MSGYGNMEIRDAYLLLGAPYTLYPYTLYLMFQKSSGNS
jgi:hypothetical protein